MQAVDILQDVGLLVGNEDNVQLVQRLIHKANIVLLDRRVLRSGLGQLRERCEKRFNSRPRNLAELSRQHGLAATSAYGRCEDDLCAESAHARKAAGLI